MTKDISSYREKSLEDLEILLSESKKAICDLRFKKKAGEVKNTSVIAKNKKNVARIYTILNEKLFKRGSCA